MEFLTQFGLSRNPFSLEAEVRDYYQAAVPARILIQIQSLVMGQDHGRITVSGDAGSGKSMLALQLVGSLSPDAFRCLLIRDVSAGRPDHILAIMRGVWGIDESGDSDRDLREGGLEPVLVLDGSELLQQESKEFIDLLVEKHNLKVVDFSAIEGGDIVLAPWESSAIARMIVHRIKSAGSQTSLFDKDALLTLVKKGNGNPGEAIGLCSAALYAAWLGGVEVVDSSYTCFEGGTAEPVDAPVDHQQVAEDSRETGSPAIGIENPIPVEHQEDLQPDYSLEEEGLELDIGEETEEDPFGDLVDEEESEENEDEFADLADDLDDLDDVNRDENESSEQNLDLSDELGGLDTDDDLDGELGALDDLVDQKDESADTDDGADDGAYDLSDLTSDEEDGGLGALEDDSSLEDDLDVDLEVDLDDGLGAEDSEVDSRDEFEEGFEGLTDDAADVEESDEADEADEVVEDEGDTMDLDSEFESIMVQDDPSDAVSLDDGTNFDDAFGAISSSESEDKPVDEDESDLESMLDELKIEDDVSGEPETAGANQESAGQDITPSESIDDDLESELEDLLQEFGDL